MLSHSVRERLAGRRLSLMATIFVTVVGSILIGQQMGATSSRLAQFLIGAPFLGLVAVLALRKPRTYNLFRICLVLMWLDIPRLSQKLGAVWSVLSMISIPEGIVYFLALVLVVETGDNKSYVHIDHTDLAVSAGMLAFVLAGGLAALFSSDPGIALAYWVRVCLLSVATLYVTVRMVQSAEQAEGMIAALVVSMIFLAIVVAILGSTERFYATAEALWTTRASRAGGAFQVGPLFIFAEPVTLGEYAAAGVAVTLAYSLAGRSSQVRWAALAASFILMVAVLLTNSRAPLIGMILAVIVVWLATLVANRLRILWQAIGLLLLVLVALAVLRHVTMIDPTQWLWSQRLLFFQQGVSFDPNFAGRLLLWRTYWPVFLRNPLGVGFWLGDQRINIHSFYLFILHGTGVVGAIALLIVVLIFLRACWRGLYAVDARHHTLAIAALGFVLVYFTSGVTSILVLDSYKNIALWVMIGIVLALDRSARQRAVGATPRARAE